MTMQFSYVAFNGEGKERNGQLEAASAQDAIRILRDMGLFVSRVESHPPQELGVEMATNPAITGSPVSGCTPGTGDPARCMVCGKIAQAERTLRLSTIRSDSGKTLAQILLQSPLCSEHEGGSSLKVSAFWE